MELTVGTFNVNNLFSRFNFRAEIDALDEGLTATYSFADPARFRVRTYEGRLVHGKPDAARAQVAARLLSPQVEVWALQEVEDIDTLRFFASQELQASYPHLVLLEGNDPRLIDVAVLSRLPLGAVTSWQHATHPLAPGERVFSRDLLEVDVYDPKRRRRLLTLFTTHLKSQYVPFGEDEQAARAEADERRRRQAETIARIVRGRTRPDGRHLVCGDLNDSPGSPPLAPLTQAADLGLVDALADPRETRPPKPDQPPPPGPAWYEQIWLSPRLAARQTAAWIDRRTKHSGDGSDHDPAWVALSL